MSCIVHVTKHFALGRGHFAWCEKHGRLNAKTGKPTTSKVMPFVPLRETAESVARRHAEAS